MAKTVKKKKLTVKTVKGAPSTNAELQSAIDQGETATQAGADPAAPATQATLAPQAAVAQGKPASYTLAGILAIVGTVFWIALILLQVMEWDHLSAAFPQM